MIVLIQEPWDATAVEASVAPLCALAEARRPEPGAPLLMLLPMADRARTAAAAELLESLGSVARRRALFQARTAWGADPAGAMVDHIRGAMGERAAARAARAEG